MNSILRKDIRIKNCLYTNSYVQMVCLQVLLDVTRFWDISINVTLIKTWYENVWKHIFFTVHHLSVFLKVFQFNRSISWIKCTENDEIYSLGCYTVEVVRIPWPSLLFRGIPYDLEFKIFVERNVSCTQNSRTTAGNHSPYFEA